MICSPIFGIRFPFSSTPTLFQSSSTSTHLRCRTSCCTVQPCRRHRGATSPSALSSPSSPPSPSCSGTSRPCQPSPRCCFDWRSNARSTTTRCPGCAGQRRGGFTSPSGKLLYSHNLKEGKEGGNQSTKWKESRRKPVFSHNLKEEKGETKRKPMERVQRLGPAPCDKSPYTILA